MTFSWRRCTHCHFMYYGSDLAEFGASTDGLSSDESQSRQRKFTMGNSSMLARHFAQAGYGEVCDDDYDDPLLNDQAPRAKVLPKSYYCSQECYWSAVFQIDDNYAM